MQTLTFVNQSTALSPTDAQTIVDAIQIQVSRDLLPAWGKDAHCVLLPQGSHPALGSWVLAFLDNADQAGALGYHDETPDGLPLGKIFVKTTIADGAKVSVCASHETLELLIDPWINLTAELDNTSGQPVRFYAYEIADAPEDDQFGYLINGVTVSDFVFPAWFEGFRAANSTQFDQMKHISKPFQILTGGYMGVIDIRRSTGWHQIFNENDPKAIKASRAPVGSRRERRRVSHQAWIKSTYKPNSEPVAVNVAHDPISGSKVIDAPVRKAVSEADIAAALAALEGVVRVADRKTTEFDAARGVIARLRFADGGPVPNIPYIVGQ